MDIILEKVQNKNRSYHSNKRKRNGKYSLNKGEYYGKIRNAKTGSKRASRDAEQ